MLKFAYDEQVLFLKQVNRPLAVGDFAGVVCRCQVEYIVNVIAIEKRLAGREQAGTNRQLSKVTEQRSSLVVTADNGRRVRDGHNTRDATKARAAVSVSNRLSRLGSIFFMECEFAALIEPVWLRESPESFGCRRWR
jgi:hypothetical protein